MGKKPPKLGRPALKDGEGRNRKIAVMFSEEEEAEIIKIIAATPATNALGKPKSKSKSEWAREVILAALKGVQ
jgi:hypothetical protein